MIDYEALRLRADPLADRVIRGAYPEGRSAIVALNSVLRGVDKNDDALSPELPAPLRAYLESGADIGRPSGGWDEERLALGSRLYMDYCFHIPMVLQFGTMPLLYAAKHGVKVLAFTGRLTRNAHQRSVETGQMVQDVMDPAGFSPNGRARRTTQKVRLLHAAVRYAILTAPQKWDTPQWGAPINQEDLLGTLFSFTVTVLDGLQKLGAVFTEEEAEAYYYRWRAVGELMGIERELIPPDLVAARAAFDAQQERSFGPSEEGRRLMATWLLTLEQQVPGANLHPLFPAMCSWLGGPKAASALGLPDPAEVEERLSSIASYFTQIDNTLEHGSLVRRGLNTVANGVYQLLYIKERGLERHTFQLPMAMDIGSSVPGSSPALIAKFLSSRTEKDKHVMLSSVPRLMAMVAYADGRFDSLERTEVRRVIDHDIARTLGEDFRWSWEARRETQALLSGTRDVPAMDDQAWLWRLGAIIDEMPPKLAEIYTDATMKLCLSVAQASGTMLWLGLGVSSNEADVLQRIRDALKVRGTTTVNLQGTAAWAHIRRLDVGSGITVWTEGDPSPPAVVFIESGKVEIVRDGVRIDTSGAGEILGEMALFTGRPRSATVRALTDTRLLVLYRDGYQALREEGSDVVVNLERRILEMQGARLRRLDLLIASGAQAVPLIKPSPGVFARIRSMFQAAPEAAVAPNRGDIVSALAKSPLFLDEPPAALDRIAHQLEHRAFPEGHFLTRQGDPGEDLFIVWQGTLDVFVATPDAEDRDRVLPLGELGPGAVCGLSSLLDDRGRMVSCVARTAVEVLVLDRAHWQQYVKESSPVASTVRAAMIRAYADQLADAGGRVASGGKDLRSVRARLDHTRTTLSD